MSLGSKLQGDTKESILALKGHLEGSKAFFFGQISNYLRTVRCLQAEASVCWGNFSSALLCRVYEQHLCSFQGILSVRTKISVNSSIYINISELQSEVVKKYRTLRNLPPICWNSRVHLRNPNLHKMSRVRS